MPPTHSHEKLMNSQCMLPSPPQAVASDKAAMSKILSRTPMGRVGEPSEVASVVKL